MADKVTIGSLIVLTNRDTRQAPFAPADVPAPGKDPIEQNIPAPDVSRINLTSPAAPQPSQDPGKANLPAAQQPSQPVTPVTFGDKLQQVPKVTPTQESPAQPSQSVSPSRPPADPIKVDQPTLPREMPFQPPPDISLSKEPSGLQTVPSVPLSHPPADVQDAPALPTSREPAGVVFVPETRLAASPAEPVKINDPPRTVVAADQPAPPISLTSPALPQPSQDITLSREPASPRELDEMPRTVVAAEQKGPDITLASPPAEPRKLDEMPRTVEAARQPAPDISPTKEPAGPQKLDDFPRTHEAAFQPPQVPGKPAELAFEPAPPPSAPAILPPMPAPPPRLPAELPPPPDFKPAPNAVLPFEPAPPPSKPADLPPPPDFKPNPNATLPGPPNFVPAPNAVLPAEPAPPPSSPATLPPPPAFAPQPNASLPGPVPFAPQPNATLPAPPAVVNSPTQPAGQNMPSTTDSIGRAPYAPGGQIDPSRDYLGSLQMVDAQVKDFLHTLDPYSFIGGGDQGSQGLNPQLYARQLVRMGTQIGATGLAAFGLTQTGLFALNQVGRFWNPATAAPPPGLEGIGRAAADSYDTFEDRFGRGEIFNIKQIVDDFFNGSNNSRVIVDDAATGYRKVDITQLYVPKLRTLTGIALPKLSTVKKSPQDPLLNRHFPGGIIPANIDSGKEKNGFITLPRGNDPAEQIKDDTAYVPLMFMDMRPNAGTNDVRAVYFRPFITNLSEEFSPEWNKQSFFGRVDPVATYMSTGRTINLGFIAYAFQPQDLHVIYQKLNWLISMVYPEYDKDLLFKSGPAVRMRVGDVINSAGGRGLPGVIDSLSIDYNEMVWELTKGSKVPMGYRVSLTFQVLHDTPVGRGINGKFGGIGTVNSEGKYQPPASVKESDAKGPEMSTGASSVFRNQLGRDMNDYDE